MVRTLTSKTILLLFIGVVGTRGLAQEDSNGQFLISGVIWDGETYEPLPYAHVYTSSFGTLSNSEGKYQILVQAGDTINISFLGFKPQFEIISATNSNYFFWMKPFVNNLEEIVVRPFHTEEELKGILLQTEIDDLPNKVKATNNLRNVNKLYLHGYRAEMNSLDNYLNHMRGPQGVSIFSTNPNKGVFRWWKNAKRK